MTEMHQSLLNQLQAIAQMKKGSRKDFDFFGQEDFVIQKGKDFKSQKYPEKYKGHRGKAKLCFTNAFNLSQRFPELIYVEGYGMSPKIPLAIHHAFCVDKEGGVVDPTWDSQEEIAYFGVEFKQEYVVETILRTEHYGILENWTEGFPLLTSKDDHQKKDFSYR